MGETNPDVRGVTTFLTQDPDDLGVLLEHELEFQETSMASLLHKKLQEVKDMDVKLASMKENYAERIRRVKEGEKRFLKKQAEMRDSIQAFEKYILDSDGKRTRALRKAVEQRRLRETKEGVIVNLKKELEELKTKRGSLVEQLQHLKRYEQYLSSVVQIESQWDNIDELLNRHRVLVTANGDLQESARALDSKLEEYQNKLQKLHKEKTNEVLVKNSDVARLLKRLEDATALQQQVEAEAHKVDRTSKAIISRLALVQMATKNLYNRVLLSYESRKPKPIEMRMDVDDSNRRLLDYLSRILNEVAERLIELDSIHKERPHETHRTYRTAPFVEKKETKREIA